MPGMTDSEKQALALWTSRYKRWESFVTNGYLPKWERFYKAYRCYVEDRKDNLSNLFLPFIFSMVETVQPRFIEAFFANKPWMTVLPQGADDVEPARAQEQLIQWQLEERMDFLTKAADWLKSCLIYGTAIGMVTWKLERHVRQKLKRVRVPLGFGYSVPLWSGIQTVNEITYDDNWFDHIDLGGFFFEPRAADIEDALYCGHLGYVNWAYLKMMEGQGFFKNLDLVEKASLAHESPVFARLNAIGLGKDADDTEDKQGRTYELMHCFEDDRYTVICNREVVIRDGPNPYYHKRKPYVRIVDIPIPHEFYGMGEVEPSEYLQYGLNDLTNAQMDYILMSILGVFLLDENSKLTAKDLQLHPRKIIRVGAEDNLRPWEMPPLNPASFSLGETLKMFMENSTGSGDIVRGQEMGRKATATEVSTVQQMAEARFRLKVRLINNSGMRPVAKLMALNNQQFVRQDKAIRIAGEEGYSFPTFRPELLQGEFDFRPTGVAEEPLVSKENKRQTALEMFKLFNGDPMTNQIELRKRVWQANDEKEIEKLLTPPQPPPQPTPEVPAPAEPGLPPELAQMGGLGVA